MPTASLENIDRYLENLHWRYATKKFDSDRQVSDRQFKQLMDAVRLTPSSYGLQPFSVIVVQDPEVRQRLRPACWDQPQITDASHLVLFAHKTDFDEDLVDSYLDQVARVREMDREELNGYGDFMKSKLIDLPTTQKAAWTARQAYIALGNLLAAAAQARIDACPMEGFESERVNQILDLKSRGLSVAVIAAIGYRSEEDATQHQAKVRRPEEEFFIHI